MKLLRFLHTNTSNTHLFFLLARLVDTAQGPHFPAAEDPNGEHADSQRHDTDDHLPRMAGTELAVGAEVAAQPGFQRVG